MAARQMCYLEGRNNMTNFENLVEQKHISFLFNPENKHLSDKILASNRNRNPENRGYIWDNINWVLKNPELYKLYVINNTSGVVLENVDNNEYYALIIFGNIEEIVSIISFLIDKGYKIHILNRLALQKYFEPLGFVSKDSIKLSEGTFVNTITHDKKE